MNPELFLEPKTTQYGSHMVMTNVTRPTMSKYVNIDTQFCEEYHSVTDSAFNIMIPERITHVKNMSVLSAEIPMTFNNISASLGNNTMVINVSTDQYVISVNDGFYMNSATTPNAMSNALKSYASFIKNNSATPTQTDLTDTTTTLPFIISITPAGFCTIHNNSSSTTLSVQFNVDSKGNPDVHFFKSKLGWILGFRLPSYSIPPGGTIIAETACFVLINRYLYLAVDEFNGIKQNSFLSPMPFGMIHKNILARISLDFILFGPHGSILKANRTNGLLVSDTRVYKGGVDIQKLNISVLNEWGKPVFFNGQDFSICIKVDHE